MNAWLLSREELRHVLTHCCGCASSLGAAHGSRMHCGSVQEVMQLAWEMA